MNDNNKQKNTPELDGSTCLFQVDEELERIRHQEANKKKIEEFKAMNSRRKQKQIPKLDIKEKDIDNLLDTQVIMKVTPNKNLYDTVVIKLDDIIKNKKSLKSNSSKKITKTEKYTSKKKNKALFKKDITKKPNDVHIKVNSNTFFIQQKNLSIIALNQICNNINKEDKDKARKHSNIIDLNTIKNIHVNKTNYLNSKERLNEYATKKMYNQYAPKETPKYKMYKYSVILTSIVFLFSLYSIVQWFYEGYSIKTLSENIIEDITIEEINSNEETLYNIADSEAKSYNDKTSLYWKYLNTPLQSVDLNSLIKQNSDTVGWLKVNNTNVNYPVVQTTDNDYYLYHSFNKSFNYAGWVFADYRDDLENFNKNMIIYGHGRKDKVMFGSLLQAIEPSWYQNTDNQIIQLSTIKYNTMWQIFSIYTIEAESYYITTDFSNDESYNSFLTTMKSRSIYDFGIELNENDKLLTLSTCYNDTGTRLVIHAKLVKIQEK